MQTTIYYRESDEYLIRKLEEMARRERKSKSACLLSLLETYFEAERRLGEILADLGVVSREDIEKSLQQQKEEGLEKKIGEIMLEAGYIKEMDLDRALDIQARRN